MKKTQKAQISFEAIAVIALLALFLMFLLSILVFNNSITNYYKKTYQTYKLCEKIKQAAEQAWLYNVSALIYAYKNFSVKGTSINIENYTCFAWPSFQANNLSEGKIRISKYRNLVKIENV